MEINRYRQMLNWGNNKLLNNSTIIDSLKIELIFFVIYAHVCGVNFFNQYNVLIYDFFYTFHMPLFIFISGYLTHCNDKKKIFKRIIRLLETYCVFQIIRMCLSNDFSFVSIFVPKSTLWYLLSLFYWRIACYFLSKWFPGKKFKLVLAISSILCLTVGYINIGTLLSFQRTFVFAPFFFLGYYLQGKDIFYILKSKSKLLFACIIICNIIVLILINKNLSIYLHQSHPYFDYGFNLYTAPLIRLIILIDSLLMSFAIVNILPSMKFKHKVDTLIIYVFHYFFVDLYEVIHISPHPVLCFLYSIAIFILLYYFQNNKVLLFICNPISKTLEKVYR